MSVQIYALKRNFDVQKAERYFKERRITYQFIDLSRHKMGVREMKSVIDRVGLKKLVDSDSPAYRESTVGYLSGADAIIEALIANPKLLRTPIVRSGRLATVGYCPEEWEKWE